MCGLWLPQLRRNYGIKVDENNVRVDTVVLNPCSSSVVRVSELKTTFQVDRTCSQFEVFHYNNAYNK